MRLAGKVAVVTGGGAGIGRALARAIADEGAARVVVADLGGAEAVAREIGGVGATCDVTSENDVRALLDRFGPVDAYFANAGTAAGSDEQTPDEVWDHAIAVNVRAHVTAARLLIPDWLERGTGCFVVTASAAGLLTQIGVAPYAVTKHAAVAFAEWLSVTYGDRGIHVSCVCPMGVDTPMARSGMESVPCWGVCRRAPAGSIRRRSSRSRSCSHDRRRRHARAAARGGPAAVPARDREPPGRERHARRPSGAAAVLQRLPRARRAPCRTRRGGRRRAALGRRRRGVAARVRRHRAPPAARARARRVQGEPGVPAVRLRVPRQHGCDRGARRPRGGGLLGRAQSRVDRRRLPTRARRDDRLPARRPRRARRRAAPGATRAAR
jgi:NAD(P)-dependent dehydrogenase (short-subunit alcohol dehydrogenase family)